MSFHLYLLECNDGSYYVGHTDNLERRLELHCSASIPNAYTSSRLPVKLVWVSQFESRAEALAGERQIKGWSRAKKKALIQGNWSELSRLARSHSPDRGVGAHSRGSTGSPKTARGNQG